VTKKKPDAPGEEPVHEAYERPELVPIELEAEQVLAVGCKTATQPALGGQPSCGFASGCNTIGS
jgi:hypothetical protein